MSDGNESAELAARRRGRSVRVRARSRRRGVVLGQERRGQLGIDSDDEYLPYASEVEDGHNFVEIAAGARHVCAVESDGSVWCWGDNSFGQLGLGNGDSESSVPTQVGEIQVSGAEDAFPALGRDFSAVLARGRGQPALLGREPVRPARRRRHRGPQRAAPPCRA